MSEINTDAVRDPADPEEWYHMRVNFIKCSYTWTINNFSSLGKTLIKSPTFSSAYYEEVKWLLKIFPEGRHDGFADEVSLYLVRVDACPKNPTNQVLAKFRCCVVNAKGEKTNCRETKGTRRFFGGIYDEFGYLRFISRELLLDEANQLLPDDELTILCEVSVVKDVTEIAEPSTGVGLQFEIPQFKLGKDLGSLFENQKFSDTTLSAGDKDFFVYKGILASRSKVFAEMFEKNKNKIRVTDVDPAVLEEMLRYIYTGETLNIGEMAESLLKVAHKYDLEMLITRCQNVLSSKLSTENAANTLIIADLYNLSELRGRTIDFMVAYAKPIVATSAWKNMIPTHPHLVGEVCQALAGAGDEKNHRFKLVW